MSLRKKQKLDKANPLRPGQYIQSPNGKYKLIMRYDGNVVLEDEHGAVFWTTGTKKTGNSSNSLTISTDGWLRVRGGRKTHWSAPTRAKGYCDVRLDDHARLGLYEWKDSIVWEATIRIPSDYYNLFPVLYSGKLGNTQARGSNIPVFDSLCTYTKGGRNYVLIHRKDKAWSLHEVTSDGIAETALNSGEFSSFFKTLTPYTVVGRTNVFMQDEGMRESYGIFSEDNTSTRPNFSFPVFYESIVSFQIGGRAFLYAHHRDWKIYEVNDNLVETASGTWNPNFTCVRIFSIAGRAYLFLQDSPNGTWFLRELTPRGFRDGVGSTGKWDISCDRVVAYTRGGRTFLLGVSGKQWRITEVAADCQMGEEVARGTFHGLYKKFEVLTIDGDPYVLGFAEAGGSPEPRRDIVDMRPPSVLEMGQTLKEGESLLSPNDAYRLTYESDGKLLLRHWGIGIWWIRHQGKTCGHVLMQENGQLAIYDANHTVVWKSRNSGDYLDCSCWLTDDGNLVVYTQDGRPIAFRKAGAPSREPRNVPSRSSIGVNGCLTAAQCLKSPNGKLILVYQSDGDLVLRDHNHTTLWSTQTSGASCGKVSFYYGHVVVRDAEGTVVWAADRGTMNAHRLELTDEGVFAQGARTWTWPRDMPPGSRSLSRLRTSDRLYPGDTLEFPQGVNVLDYQADGNLVLKGRYGAILWSTNTAGNSGGRLLIERGHLIMFDSHFDVIWTTAENGDIQEQGNIDTLRLNSSGILGGYSRNKKMVWSPECSGVDSMGYLTATQYLKSPNGKYRLVYQSDGDLVLKNHNDTTLWSTQTSGTPCGKVSFCYGHLVVRDAEGIVVWAADRETGSWLCLTDEGDVLSLREDGTQAWSPDMPEESKLVGEMKRHQCLYPGQTLESPSGIFALDYQSDGNLVLRDQHNTTWWSTNTAGKSGGRLLIYRRHLIMLDYHFDVIWASAETGNLQGFGGIYSLHLYDSGILIGKSDSGGIRWSAERSEFGINGSLTIWQYLISSNGKYRLVYKSDGDLVLKNQDDTTVWSTQTSGTSCGKVSFCYGHLVVRDTEGTVVWAADRETGSRLCLTDEGGVLSLREDGTQAWSPDMPEVSQLVGEMKRHQCLYPGQTLVSPSGTFVLDYQTDGDLVLKDQQNPDATWWRTQTVGNSGGRLLIDRGHLIMLNNDFEVSWTTAENGDIQGVGSIDSLRLDDHGNLVGYSRSDEKKWSIERSGFNQSGYLTATQCLRSPNGDYTFVYQSDGDLVLKDHNQKTLWKSQTSGTSCGKVSFYNGHLVVRDAQGTVVWAADGEEGSHLSLTDEGSVLSRRHDGTRAWSTNMSDVPRLVGEMKRYQRLYPGQTLESPSGTFILAYQEDGNLVLKDQHHATWWSTNTAGSSGGRLLIRGDLILFDSQFEVRWTSAEGGGAISSLRLDDKGHLAGYYGDREKWSAKLTPPPSFNQLMFRYDGKFAGGRTRGTITQLPDTLCVYTCLDVDESFLITHQKDRSYQISRVWARVEKPFKSGRFPVFYPSMHDLMWSNVPLMLAQQADGSWTIYQMPVYSEGRSALGSGKFGQFYQVIVPYSRENRHYLFLHASDGRWKTIEIVSGFAMEERSSGDLKGNYSVAAPFIENGIPYVFVHDNGKGCHRILELCTDGVAHQTPLEVTSWSVVIEAALIVHRYGQNWLQIQNRDNYWLSREIFSKGLNTCDGMVKTENLYTKVAKVCWEDLEYAIGFSESAAAEVEAHSIERPPIEITAWATWSFKDKWQADPTIEALPKWKGRLPDHPLAVTTFMRGDQPDSSVYVHYSDGSWIQYLVQESGAIRIHTRGNLGKAYPLLVAIGGYSIGMRRGFFGQAANGVWAYWDGDLRGSPMFSGQFQRPYARILANGNKSELLGITADGACWEIQVGAHASATPLTTTQRDDLGGGIGTAWKSVIVVNLQGSKGHGLVTQSPSGRAYLWVDMQVVATVELGKYYRVLQEAHNFNSRTGLIAIDDTGSWQLLRIDEQPWRITSVTSGALSDAPAKVFPVCRQNETFLFGTIKKQSERAPGYAWMIQAVRDSGLPGGVKASGVLASWPENAFVLDVNNQLCVLGQNDETAAMSTILPFSGSIGRRNRPGTLRTRYAVFISCSIGAYRCVLGHTQDGKWDLYRRLGSSVVGTAMAVQGAPNGYYALVATYQAGSRTFCFMQKDDRTWSIRELKRPSSMTVVSSGQMERAFVSFTPFVNGKLYAIAWTHGGSWYTYELSPTGQAPRKIAHHPSLSGIRDVSVLPPVGGHPRFFAYVNGNPRTNERWQIVELVDGGRRFRIVAAGTCATNWTRILVVNAHNKAWIVGLLEEDTPTKPLTITHINRSKHLGLAESTQADESGESRNYFKPSYSYGTIVASIQEIQQTLDRYVGPGKAHVEQRLAPFVTEKKQRRGRRLGVVLGGGSIRLPGISVSFRRGLVIQMLVKPLVLNGEMDLLDLGGAKNVASRIRLGAKADGSVELGWHAADGTWYLWRSGLSELECDRWQMLTVTMDSNGCKLFRDGSERPFLSDRGWKLASPGKNASELERAEYQAERDKMDPLPVEHPRAAGQFGGAGGGSLCIGEARLWNRADTEVILERSHRRLNGDEIGLIGWWVFEEPDAVRFDDKSSFGRHAYRQGELSESPLPAYAFAPNPVATGRQATRFDGQSEVTIEEVAIPGPDFTWQGFVKFDQSPSDAKLLEVESLQVDRGWNGDSLHTTRLLSITAVPDAIHLNGEISIALGGEVISETVRFTCSWAVETSKGRQAHLTITRDIEGRFSLFRYGTRVGEPIVCTMIRTPSSMKHLATQHVREMSMKKYVTSNAATVARLFDQNISYKLTTGRNLVGGLQEVRLWSRCLSDAEVFDTSRRRVHNWAPRLTAYLRLDDYHPSATFLNGALGAEPVSSNAVGTGKPIRYSLLGDAPDLDLPRALWLSQNKVSMGTRGLAIARALSIQFWVRLDTTKAQVGDSKMVEALDAVTSLFHDGEGTPPNFAEQAAAEAAKVLWGDGAKNLLRLSDGDKAWLDLKAYEDGRVVLTYDDEDKQSQDMVVGHLLDPGGWTHVTLVIEPSGATEFYRNGAFVGREMNGVLCAPETERVVLGDIPAAIAELRLWNRSLSALEIQQNMHRKLRDTGCLRSYGLNNPDDLRYASSKGKNYFVEAPGLQLSWDPKPARSMVKTHCEVIPDQSETGTSSPTLAIDLQPLDEQGQALLNTKVEVLFESNADAYRDYVAPSNCLDFTPGSVFEVCTNSQGRFRVAIRLSSLEAPMIRLRHAGMAENEWNIVSPGDAIFKAMYGVTATELTNGHAGSSTTKKRDGIAKTAADGKQIESFLRLLTAPALAARFETETTQFLAFGNDLEDEPTTPTVSTEVAAGVHTITCDENQVLVQRLSMPNTAIVPQVEQPDAILSFGFLDSLAGFADFVRDGVDWVTEGVAKVGSVVRDGITATYRIVDGVLESVKYVIGAVVNGITVALEFVVTTIAEIAKAIWDFVKAIGVTLWEFTKFLFGLFDFADFIEASNYMLGTVNQAIDAALPQGNRIFAWLSDNTNELGHLLTRTLGASDRSGDSDISQGLTKVGGAALEALRPLMWLLSLLTKPFELLFGGLVSHFQPLFDALETIESTVLTTFSSVLTRVGTSLVALVTDVDEILTGNLEVVREFAAEAAGAIVDILKAGVSLGKQLLKPLLDSLKSVLNVRIDIPVVTFLLESIIGAELTIGRVVTLVAAVPTVLLYKISRGTTSSPFSTEALSSSDSGGDSMPVSYGDSEEESSTSAGELALRGVGLSVSLLTFPMDVVAAADVKIPKGILIGRLVGDLLHDGVLGLPHLNNIISESEPPQSSPRSCGLGYTAWGLSMLSYGAVGLALYKSKSEDAWNNVSGVIGVLGGTFSTINTIWDTAEADSGKVKGAFECCTELVSLASGCAGLFIPPGPKQATVVGGLLGANLWLTTAALTTAIVEA